MKPEIMSGLMIALQCWVDGVFDHLFSLYGVPYLTAAVVVTTTAA